jgi:hypothetical protein
LSCKMKSGLGVGEFVQIRRWMYVSLAYVSKAEWLLVAYI